MNWFPKRNELVSKTWFENIGFKTGAPARELKVSRVTCMIGAGGGGGGRQLVVLMVVVAGATQLSLLLPTSYIASSPPGRHPSRSFCSLGQVLESFGFGSFP